MKLKKKNSRMLLGAVLVAIAAVTVLGALVVTKGAGFGDFRSRASSNPLEQMKTRVKADVDAAILTPLFVLFKDGQHYYTILEDEKTAKLAEDWTEVVEDSFMVPSTASQFAKSINRVKKGNKWYLEFLSSIPSLPDITKGPNVFYAYANQINGIPSSQVGLQNVQCLEKGIDRVYVLQNRVSFYAQQDYKACKPLVPPSGYSNIQQNHYTANDGSRTTTCVDRRTHKTVPCPDEDPVNPASVKPATSTPAFAIPVRQTND